MNENPVRFVAIKERLATIRAEMASLGTHKGMTRRERIQMLDRLVREMGETQGELDELRQQAAQLAASLSEQRER
jgi:hypothetical protein